MSLDEWIKKAKKDGIVKEDSLPVKKEPVDILPKPLSKKDRLHNKDPNRKHIYLRFIEMFPETVGKWLKYKPRGTRKTYGTSFCLFCRKANILPKDFGELARIKARNLAWDILQEIRESSPHVAKSTMQAIMSFYRFYTQGEKLPFDTQKGGHHQISIRESDKRQKYRWGPIDQTRETVFNIINEAGSLRDRCIYTLALTTGIRENGFESLKWKHLKQVLKIEDQDIVVIKVTPEIDSKIDTYRIPFYYAFVSGHALELLRRYEERYRGNRSDEDYVFYAIGGHGESRLKKLARYTIGTNFKKLIRRCIRQGVLPSDAKNKIWFHQLRALFKKFVRNSPITDDEFKEFIMGHVLTGSRENYADRDSIELAKEYLKIDFEPPLKSLKRKFLIEQQKREEMEDTIKKVESRPIPPTPIKPIPHTIQEKASIKPNSKLPIGPPPKYCLRNLSFTHATDDSYCHETCIKATPTKYKACQEVKAENPELFNT